MKIAFFKTHDHLCTNCDKQYNWKQGESVRYAKIEYISEEKRKEDEKHFCSEVCYRTWSGQKKNKVMEVINEKASKGKWFLEMSDLTIRVKGAGVSDCMGDYKGNIIADLKPSLGITEGDVANGVLSKDYEFSYLNKKGGRQHAFEEVIANANSICNVMNKTRNIDK